MSIFIKVKTTAIQIFRMMHMHTIEVRDISKRFKTKEGFVDALKNINLRIEEGEIFGLLGPNGAGKTTLINILIGIVYPDKGSVRILGKNPFKDRGVFEQMNCVLSGARFHWILSPREILKFYGMIYGLDKKTIQERTKELMSFFGMEGIADRKFRYLSTGEKARLSLAKSLLNQPKVILMDEPTLGLDPEISQRVREEIKRINREFKTTIVLTTHYMNEAEQLSDRIAFINKGEIADIGTVEKVKLKKFLGYDVSIKVREIKGLQFLKKSGFRVSGRTIAKTIKKDTELNDILSLLVGSGYEVLNIEVKKPTLEDYFIRMVRGG